MATLSDGTKTLKFPLTPEQIQVSIAGEYASNNVLDTSNPQIRRKYSVTTHKLSRCLLVSDSGKVNQQPFINTIQYWAKNQTRLTFKSNSHILKICYIKSLSMSVKMWNSGQPTFAEMEIELIEASPEPSTGKDKQAPTTGTTAKKITPREQDKLKKTVDNKLKSPVKRQIIGITEDGYLVEVDDDKKVTIKNKQRKLAFDYDNLLEKLG